MKRPALIILLACAFAGCFSKPTTTRIHTSVDINNYERIAVLPFQTVNGDGLAMADAFVTGFMQAGFMAIERSVLEGIFIQEKLDFKSGAMNPQDLIKVAQAANVDAVVFGSVSADPQAAGGNVRSVSLRMVDAQTGEVILSSTYRNSAYLEAPEIPSKMMKNIRTVYRKAKKRGAVLN